MGQYIYKIILELWEFRAFLQCPMFAFILIEEEKTSNDPENGAARQNG